MRPNPLLAKLARGEPVFGPMIMEFATPGLPQMMVNAGADFVVYDQEAGCLDLATVRNQLALTRGLPIVPLVNVPWHDYHHLVQPLDCGAMGIMVPVVENASQAKAIARITHYPPIGVRGAAFGIAHDDFQGVDLPRSIAEADARNLIIAKIETVKGVENIDAIMSTPGIDIAFVGHMDLSVSLGTPGRYDTPEFEAAMDHVIAACKANGKHGACLITSPEAARRWLARGYRFIISSNDIIMFTAGLRAGIEGLRTL